MLGTVGWLCPKCNTVYAPGESTCAKCSGTKLSFGTMSFRGTLMPADAWPGTLSSGTFFIGARPTTPPPPSYKETRADEVIEDWKSGDGGWKALRALIIDAMQDVVEDEDEDEDEDE